MTLDHLNKSFAIPGVVRFEAGNHGLTRMTVTTPAAEAEVYLHGAHVTRYQRPGEKPILWMSRESFFEPDKAIRGGIPVIFPWFGPRQGRPDSPPHGFVRTAQWHVESVRQQANGSLVAALTLNSSDATRATWPHDFSLRLAIHVGTTLEVSLETRNTGHTPFSFEEALHSYFQISDIARVSISGLEGVTYISKSEGMSRVTQASEPITFTRETDRVYLNTQSTCVLDDPILKRKITVEKSGSDTTVVWNPWVTKAKAMPDFGDDEWSAMACIETANATDNAVTLPAGAAHTMTVRIR